MAIQCGFNQDQWGLNGIFLGIIGYAISNMTLQFVVIFQTKTKYAQGV
jgi:hypothetical protein